MKKCMPLAALAALTVIATPAAAQTADVRIRIDTQAIREAAEEARIVLREVLGPELRLELQHGLNSLSRDLADVIGDISRDISRELGRDWSREFRGFRGWDGAWSENQRNFPASQTDTETRTFAIGANGEFDLENISGDIQIRPGSGRDVTIEIRRHARGRTESDARTGLSRVRVETLHRGDRVTARTVYPNERQSNYSVSVDYIVTAPAGTRVNARTVSGDVTVGAITGDLSVHTTSGDMRITNATRLLTAKTASGDVVLTGVGAEGLLTASTLSGDVTATGVKARRLELTSVSGDVTARQVQSSDVKLASTSGDLIFDGDLQANGRYTLQTHAGDARLSLDGRTGFQFEASTFTGTVRTDLPLQVQSFGSERRRANRNVRGTFGDGSAMVTATSFSGDVIVTKR